MKVDPLVKMGAMETYPIAGISVTKEEMLSFNVGDPIRDPTLITIQAPTV